MFRRKRAPTTALAALLLTLCVVLSQPAFGKKGRLPEVQETETGRVLVLPEDLAVHLEAEFPGYQIPDQSSFDDKMLRYYFSNLIGIHPAVAWGDFNGDKKNDFALILITGKTPWGPLVEVVVLNGEKKGKFETFRIGEIYNYKEDYLRSRDDKLYKGSFQKGGWYVDWDSRTKEYRIRKS